jgi:hypothetical protein
MTPPRVCLVERIQGLLERTYRIESGVRDIGRFIIGDAGYRAIYAGRRVVTSADAEAGTGARTLVRETPQGIRACIYYPDDLIRRLEAHPPVRGVTDENVGAFATLVEELDHFLCIAERASETRPSTLFELELHANVSKHLVLSRYLAGSRGRLGAGARAWLRLRLFEDGEDPRRDARERARYRDAARWAVRFLGSIERLDAGTRVATLRRFHALSSAEKVELIERLAA